MGPQILDEYTQRTASNLLLYVEYGAGDQDGDSLAVVNSGVGMYPYAINYGELPNLNEKDIVDLKMIGSIEWPIFNVRL